MDSRGATIFTGLIIGIYGFPKELTQTQQQ